MGNRVGTAAPYTTLKAHDGDIAMDLARETHPDLIILDIRLPFTSGFDVIKQLKNDEFLQDIPVVAVTALTDDSKKDEYLRHGFDDFLAKPIAISDFIKIVADFIDPTPYTVH